ncbi:uncharacterized protein DEA37_0001273 [Paragonimus westermani]|uniref:Reverse transcriptase domain-containing protein n=1 Tax=Paragonimus westermani TaxID=34504 RepID=A0A5J4P1A6_9TREM|nr:uncharacterized protein DEA37_0001273 [Paragonimus westermani]
MDRVIQVTVDGALSNPVAVTSGVPQGSVLEPTLFLIYANDIPNLVRCKVVLFADDIKLCASIHTSDDRVLLQKDPNALQTLPSILNTYIRPTMEYAVQVWSPWLHKDIVLLQRIYHRTTNLVTGLQSKPYEERIESLKLFDFCYRRIRGDLILTYNILRTPNHPLQKRFVRREPRISRTHDYFLAAPHSRGNILEALSVVTGSAFMQKFIPTIGTLYNKEVYAYHFPA